MADVTMKPCGDCGMPCTPAEYHPYAACLMFKACHNSAAVRAKLPDYEALRAEMVNIERENREGWKQAAHWRSNAEQAATELESLRKRCEAVEADAARYRWIRTMAHEVIDWDYMPPLPEGFNPLYSGCSDSLEASIDAAIAAAQEPSHG